VSDMIVVFDGFSCFSALTSVGLCAIDLNGRLAMCSSGCHSCDVC